MMSTTIKDDRC